MTIGYDTLFCFVDDFCKGFEPWYKKQLMPGKLKRRDRPCRLQLSEVLTILIAYHQSGMACFKYFYFDLLRNSQNLFRGRVNYQLRDSWQ